MHQQDSTDYEKDRLWLTLIAWADAHGYEVRLTRIWSVRGSWELEVKLGEGLSVGWGAPTRRAVLQRALRDIRRGL